LRAGPRLRRGKPRDRAPLDPSPSSPRRAGRFRPGVARRPRRARPLPAVPGWASKDASANDTPRPRRVPRPHTLSLLLRGLRRRRGLLRLPLRSRRPGLLQREEQPAAVAAAAVLRRLVQLASGLAAQHQLALLVLRPELDVRVTGAALLAQLRDAPAAGQLVTGPDDLDEARSELAHVPAPQPGAEELPDECQGQHARREQARKPDGVRVGLVEMEPVEVPGG